MSYSACEMCSWIGKTEDHTCPYCVGPAPMLHRTDVKGFAIHTSGEECGPIAAVPRIHWFNMDHELRHSKEGADLNEIIGYVVRTVDLWEHTPQTILLTVFVLGQPRAVPFELIEPVIDLECGLTPEAGLLKDCFLQADSPQLVIAREYP